jgi:hypothetical protein
MTRFSYFALPICSVLFLFSAFYKNLVPSPVDLSVVAGALVCICLVPWWRSFAGLKQPLVLLILALNLYLAIRLFPEYPNWGMRKLTAAFLFGLPALCAGYVIASDGRLRGVTMWTFSLLSIPLAAIVVIESLSSPLDFSTIGGSGYQITGMFFAFAMIASAVLANPYTMAASVIGALVCGNITGIAFGGAAVILIWLRRWDLKDVLKQAAWSLAVVVAYTILVAPPLAIQRTLLTSLGLAKRTELVEPPKASATVPEMFKSITTNPDKLEENATTSTERLDIWKAAIKKIEQKPFWGWGYGDVKYGAATMAHNVFLEMLAEGGLIAFGLMLAIFVVAFRQVWLANDSLALGFLLLVSLDLMISAIWGLRISLFAFGLAAGAAYHKVKSPQPPT